MATSDDQTTIFCEYSITQSLFFDVIEINSFFNLKAGLIFSVYELHCGTIPPAKGKISTKFVIWLLKIYQGTFLL